MDRIFQVCEHCNGSGKYRARIGNRGLVPPTEVVNDCDYCNGTGEIDLEPQDIPEIIYLQFWTDGEVNEQVTWCVDQIELSDIEYKRVRSHVYKEKE